MQIMVRPGFATAAECASLVDEIRKVKTLDSTVRITQLRTEMSAISLKEHGYDAIEAIRLRVLAELGQFFAVDDLRLECTILSEMHPGDFHPTHADNERRVGTAWEPNHTPFRSHAAILYLNSSGMGGDYMGGTLRFPARAVEVIPASGTLVAFPCSRDFEHEVGVVSGGHRYTVAIWCTTHPDHEEPWP
ncbi:2OG-Fe(II) oxygenase [Streptomyces sp. NPDC001604]|uniref:2OG-Fe(II) oxygenase n=1 Tax=Streptomyces sp. NPDC001604 TaxID=3364593 RepID=UPI003673CA60